MQGKSDAERPHVDALAKAVRPRARRAFPEFARRRAVLRVQRRRKCCGTRLLDRPEPIALAPVGLALIAWIQATFYPMYRSIFST
ncbi:MAG: hypothetical protein NZL99_05780 [Burkholderiaceae bacterium]|nr:hypothetical protein [Burkholderiaceae bacterium]